MLFKLLFVGHLSPEPRHLVGDNPITNWFGKRLLVTWRSRSRLIRTNIVLGKRVVYNGVGLLLV